MSSLSRWPRRCRAAPASSSRRRCCGGTARPSASSSRSAWRCCPSCSSSCCSAVSSWSGICYSRRAMLRLDRLRLAPPLIVAAGALALGTAFAAQYLGGLQPCILCLYQRYPYGVAIVLGLAGLTLAGRPGALRLVLAPGGPALPPRPPPPPL